MPWTCNCPEEMLDDKSHCPVCGMTKEEWSVKIEVTRNFTLPVRRKKKGSSWIEVQALDAERRPLEAEAYWIRLPNGRVRKGLLDARGWARLENIPPGECELRFPRFYAHDFGAHEQVEPEQEETPDLHRVELELLDADGQPVAGAAYWVKLPGRDAPVEGTLDARGRACLTAPEAGACEVRFPHLYAHDVEVSTVAIESSGRLKEDQEGPTTWVEVELQDPAGRPVSGQPFAVHLPGADEPVRGTLDARGRARVPAERAGMCRIELTGHYTHDVERVD